MKVGDLIRLPVGAEEWWGVKSKIAMIVEKQYISVSKINYTWVVLADGRIIPLGGQLESMVKVINESR